MTRLTIEEIMIRDNTWKMILTKNTLESIIEKALMRWRYPKLLIMAE
jgi:hypothetical protein